MESVNWQHLNLFCKKFVQKNEAAPSERFAILVGVTSGLLEGKGEFLKRL